MRTIITTTTMARPVWTRDKGLKTGDQERGVKCEDEDGDEGGGGNGGDGSGGGGDDGNDGDDFHK